MWWGLRLGWLRVSRGGIKGNGVAVAERRLFDNSKARSGQCG